MLLLCARFASARIFQPLLLASVLLTAVLTIAFIPLQGALANPILAGLGVVSAPLSIYMGVLLKGGERPVVLAALGLAGGNLLNLALGLLPLSDASKLGLLAGALPGILPPHRLSRGGTGQSCGRGLVLPQCAAQPCATCRKWRLP